MAPGSSDSDDNSNDDSDAASTDSRPRQPV
jgi:hypothetical protein